jgi:hypothetical protein
MHLDEFKQVRPISADLPPSPPISPHLPRTGTSPSRCHLRPISADLPRSPAGALRVRRALAGREPRAVVRGGRQRRQRADRVRRVRSADASAAARHRSRRQVDARRADAGARLVRRGGGGARACLRRDAHAARASPGGPRGEQPARGRVRGEGGARPRARLLRARAISPHLPPSAPPQARVIVHACFGTPTEEELRAAFAIFDHDGQGSIDGDEFREMLPLLCGGHLLTRTPAPPHTSTHTVHVTVAPTPRLAPIPSLAPPLAPAAQVRRAPSL